jgi:hypothetical protein
MAAETKVILTSRIPEACALMRSTVKERMAESMQVVDASLKEVLSHQGRGRTYKVPGTKGAHYQASAPGDPPAKALGDLAKSLSFGVKETATGVVGFAGTDSRVGVWLQVGTRGGKIITPKRGKFLAFEVDGQQVFTKKIIQGPIKPRPWIDVGLRKAWNTVVGIFSRPWEQR